MLFNAQLKQCRIADGLTQQAVADSLGIHVTAYSHYEKGDRFPRKETFNKLAAEYPHWLHSLLSLPLEVAMVFPPELLQNLENAISNTGNLSNTYEESRKDYLCLKEALRPVLDLKYEFLDLPTTENEKIAGGVTTKSVILDMNAEKLIWKALQLQTAYWEKILK